jgi:hypothetical protein
MPTVPVQPSQPGVTQPAPDEHTPRPQVAEYIATLRSLGYVVYRKPARRRGRFLTYTDDAGNAVRLEQLEAAPSTPENHP